MHPDIVTWAKQSRQFLIRVVRFLAGESRMRQFLDIGTGLPTMQNTHEVAQQVAPASRIVYVDFHQPVAIMFMGILGHIANFDEARSIVARMMAAVPSGSYLALYDDTNTNEAACKATTQYAATGAVPYNLRSPEQIGHCFKELEPVEPGFVPITQWRPDTVEVGTARPADLYGAVARKP